MGHQSQQCKLNVIFAGNLFLFSVLFVAYRLHGSCVVLQSINREAVNDNGKNKIIFSRDAFLRCVLCVQASCSHNFNTQVGTSPNYSWGACQVGTEQRSWLVPEIP